MSTNSITFGKMTCDSPVFCKDLYKAKQDLYAYTVMIPDSSSKQAQNVHRLDEFTMALNGLFDVLMGVLGVQQQYDFPDEKRNIDAARSLLNGIVEKDKDVHSSIKQLVKSVTLEAQQNSNNDSVKQAYVKFIGQLCHDTPYRLAPADEE